MKTIGVKSKNNQTNREKSLYPESRRATLIKKKKAKFLILFAQKCGEWKHEDKEAEKEEARGNNLPKREGDKER